MQGTRLGGFGVGLATQRRARETEDTLTTLGRAPSDPSNFHASLMPEIGRYAEQKPRQK